METIPLEALTGDAIRRDQYGRYLVVPPGGGAPVGYTRVTTVAKVLDSGGGLAPWKATMTAAGLIMRRGLRAQWETLLAEHNGDPWYASEGSKKACKALVEDCAAVGGANDRAEMGTSLHTLTALVDVGRMPTHLTEETQADIDAYIAGMAAAGVNVLPGQVEIVTVLDDWQVAGTFDRLVSVPGFNLPMIADLKTGADLSYSWQSIAVQLAAYSRGDAIYEQGPADDGSQDQRHPMPYVDQEYGLIMWLNAGTGTLELFLVDLVAGWEAFQQSMWTRRWRNATVSMHLDQYQPKVDGDGLVEQLEASIEMVEARKAAEAAATTPPVSGDSRLSVTPAEVYIADLRDWLQSRVNAVGGHSPEAKADLAARWPKSIPTLRASSEHTLEQLAEIGDLLTLVEGRHSVPFGTPAPTEPDPVAMVLHLFPGSEIINNDNDNSKEPA